jgi:tripartite ATP-independent transporter DctP family solute receptor
MKKLAFFTFVAGILFLQLFMAGCSSVESDTKIMRLAHGLDVTHPVHKAMEFMADKLREDSGGKLEIKIYPSQQLGTEREALEMLQIGSLDMTKVSAAILENFAPKIRAYSLPYLFRDTQHTYEVYDSDIGKELLKDPNQFLLQGLTYYYAGNRSFYTKNTPVRKPADLKGLKIRVQESPMAISLVNSLGGSPTPVSWGELYTALQSGIVDGAENNPPSFHTSRHYEVCKYYSIDQHTAVPDILVIGTKTWDKLSGQEKEWVQQAADSSAVYQRELWEEAEEEAFKIIKEAGVEVIRPDKEPFVEMTQPIYERIKANNPELFQVVENIRAVGRDN